MPSRLNFHSPHPSIPITISIIFYPGLNVQSFENFASDALATDGYDSLKALIERTAKANHQAYTVIVQDRGKKAA